ncbi:MAG: pseudouridine synthase [Bryobacterales bacterium]|nr:pseudouridine synthase [Bryobacterales bacterium]
MNSPRNPRKGARPRKFASPSSRPPSAGSPPQASRPTGSRRAKPDGSPAGSPRGSGPAPRSARPYAKRDDNRPPRLDDDRPPARPYAKRDDNRPPRRDDDRPPSRPYAKRDDNRPPRRDDDRPPARPYAKRDDNRPPRRDDDRPPARPYAKRDDNRPPRRDDDRPPRTGSRPAAAPARKQAARPPAQAPADALRKTLDRVLSRAGVGSRTVAANWIREGRVRVNGRIERNPEAWVHPTEDRMLLDGRLLRPEDRVYMLLYKPKGYLCTRQDPQGRPTIYELLAGVKSWVFNVGRLDLDTSGLLILTNDTELGELLTNPVYKVIKTYLVKANTLLTDEQLQRLRDGVELADGPTLPAVVRRVRDSGKYTHLEIQIHEGRNRQVRRMVEAIGAKVLKLVRTAIGPIEIAGLEIGKHRPLANEQVQALKALAMEGSGKPSIGKKQRRNWSHTEADAAWDEDRPDSSVEPGEGPEE